VDGKGNVYSQFGEDLLISNTLDQLAKKFDLDHWACEFGAWDGLHLSNTANLIINRGYSAILIEADPKKHLELLENMKTYPVECLNRFVEISPPNDLDSILMATKIPLDFDLLSIDIDGADYWIFEGLAKYQPKIIVIEFNPTIPKHVNFINPRTTSINKGSSLRSLITLAELKGYKAIGTTICNVILLRNQFADSFDESVISLDTLPEPAYQSYIWQTFDGEIHVQPDLHLLWHNVTISKKSIQVLPRYLIGFPDNMGKYKKIIFGLWKRVYARRLKNE